MSDVVCLGAGLAGMGFARALPEARVFEAERSVGGHARSHELEGVHFDQGAHICHSTDEGWLREITERAGEVVKIPQSRVVNHWRGRWVTYPVQNHLHELPVDVRTDALTDFVQAQTDSAAAGREPANYHEWCLAQYGPYLTDTFYRVYTKKYWRIAMSELATDWLAGRLLPAQVRRVVAGALAEVEERQSTFARFRYPARGGFHSFVRGMDEGLDITLGARAVSVDVDAREVRFEDGRRVSYRALASSIPLPRLVEMIPQAPDAVRGAAARLRHTRLVAVNLIVGRADLVPCDWFYVYDPNVEASRVSVPSRIAPGCAGEGRTALQAEVYRRSDEAFDVDAIVSSTIRDLARILSFDPERDVVAVDPVVVPYAYVIPDLARADAVRAIVEWLEPHGVVTMGLYGSWEFIWSDAAYRSGREAAARVRELE